MQRRKKRRVWLRVCVAILTAAALVCLCGLAQNLYRKAVYPIEYQELVERYAAQNHLPIEIVYAVIHTESRFRPDSESKIGARGLMQITEETFDWAKFRMGEDEATYDQIFDPEVNIRYGTFILSILTEEFGSVETALAAYHAGWGSVKKWLGDARYSPDGVKLAEIPFKDTAWYVPRVLHTAKIYQKLYHLEGI